MIQHKSFDLDFKADDMGGFTAYVARFGNLDRVNEVIEPGAFKNVDAFASEGWVGVNHDMKSLPVAMIENVAQDSNGLLVTAKWHSTPEAQACRAVVNERLSAGKAVKCSIGYRVLDSVKGTLEGKSITRLKALEIFEASVVLLPANPAASVLSAKSADNVLTIDALRSWLDAETKAGRVLSRSNHAKLREWQGTLEAMTAQLKAMCDEHDPDAEMEMGEGEDDSGEIPAVLAGKSANELRAALLRAQLSLLRSSL